jgi:hypothetical protein
MRINFLYQASSFSPLLKAIIPFSILAFKILIQLLIGSELSGAPANFTIFNNVTLGYSRGLSKIFQQPYNCVGRREFVFLNAAIWMVA